jgi:asparagine synthase (glutamine-hydrolysing)
MSAIGAIYHTNNKPISTDELKRFNVSMSHHGEDGHSEWIQGSCGLTQQITYLTQESLSETLPLVWNTHSLALVCNCRLFNRDELLQVLKVSAVGDATLIALAYLKWQLEFVHYIEGEFSIALWDGKEERLICISDHFNTRPLYFYHSNNLFAIASEIKALHQLPGVHRRPNLHKIAMSDRLRYQENATDTFFADIQLLPAAHFLVVDREKYTSQRYWQPTLGEPLSFSSENAFQEAFQDVFSRAIKSVTRSHRPIGLQLSGGLDSSAIAMIASREFAKQNQPLYCFSNVLSPSYSGKAKDEQTFIDYINGPSLVKVPVTDEWRGPFDGLEGFTEQYYSNSQHYQYRALNAAARERNIKIMLHGTLAEFTTSYAGWEYLIELFRQGNWSGLYHELGTYKALHGISWAKMILSYVLKPQLPYFIKARLYTQSQRQLLNSSLLNPQFIRQHLSHQQERFFNAQFMQMAIKPTYDTRNNACIELRNFLLHASTLFSDFNEAPNSTIYLSNPYFEKRLVDFCLNVPNHYRFKHGYPRSIIRQGLQGILPKAIQWRTSKGPFVPDYYDRYLRQIPYAKAVLSEVQRHPLVQEVINCKGLKRLLDAPENNFTAFIVVPRMIYLSKFLSSF